MVRTTTPYAIHIVYRLFANDCYLVYRTTKVFRYAHLARKILDADEELFGTIARIVLVPFVFRNLR